MRRRTVAESAGVSARSVASSASSFAVPTAVIALRLGELVPRARPATPRSREELLVAAGEVAAAVVGRVHAVEVVDAERVAASASTASRRSRKSA